MFGNSDISNTWERGGKLPTIDLQIILTKEYRGLSNKEGQPGPKTYYYRADFPGFFCCHTFWTFWEGNSNFKK